MAPYLPPVVARLARRVRWAQAAPRPFRLAGRAAAASLRAQRFAAAHAGTSWQEATDELHAQLTALEPERVVDALTKPARLWSNASPGFYTEVLYKTMAHLDPDRRGERELVIALARAAQQVVAHARPLLRPVDRRDGAPLPGLGPSKRTPEEREAAYRASVAKVVDQRVLIIDRTERMLAEAFLDADEHHVAFLIETHHLAHEAGEPEWADAIAARLDALISEDPARARRALDAVARNQTAVTPAAAELLVAHRTRTLEQLHHTAEPERLAFLIETAQLAFVAANTAAIERIGEELEGSLRLWPDDYTDALAAAAPQYVQSDPQYAMNLLLRTARASELIARSADADERWQPELIAARAQTLADTATELVARAEDPESLRSARDEIAAHHTLWRAISMASIGTINDGRGELDRAGAPASAYERLLEEHVQSGRNLGRLDLVGLAYEAYGEWELAAAAWEEHGDALAKRIANGQSVTEQPRNAYEAARQAWRQVPSDERVDERITELLAKVEKLPVRDDPTDRAVDTFLGR